MPSDQVINRNESAPATTARSEVDAFLADLKQRSGAGPRGRLIFALDATASREATWDAACKLQAEMFAAAKSLDLQLVYYRGVAECRASRWISSSAELAKTMSTIMCRAGTTQIEKVFSHTSRETKLVKVSALVFVGDALEEEPDQILAAAKTLGQLSVPVFMFQEGSEGLVEQTFRDVARVTHGAYCRFDPGAARELTELLRAVAAFASGGLAALADQRSDGAVKLLRQLK